MRYEVVLQAACLEQPFVGMRGLQSGGGRPAGGEGASSLGSSGGAPGASFPGLSPDVISPLRGGSAAKGQALLAPTAPGSLAGALVIWAVAGDGMCLGSPWGRGTGAWRACAFGMRSGKRDRDGGRDGWGELLGSQPTVPSLLSWKGGQKAVVKPDVCWASPAEQVGQDRATFAGLMPATASQPPDVTFQSWTWQHGGRGDAVERQHPASGMDLGRCRKEKASPEMRSSIPGLGRVMVFLAAALASASLAIPEDWGEEGVQYGQLGTDVTLSCPGVPAGSPVQWRRAGATALPEGSAIQQGSLVLPSASLASVGTYSCHGEDGGLLHTVSLRLGHLPGVPFVSCRASDYENFSCSWTSSVETFLPTRYITTYRKKSLTGEEKRRNKNGHVGLCLQDPSRPSTCTVHRSEFWSSYRLNITEVNPLGFSYRLLDVTMQAIIKPDPPEGLVVEPVPLAPRRLHVSWKYPSSWPKEPHFQLRFRLQYRPVIHHSWSVVETVNLSEVITDAFAGLEHVVRVSAKDFLDAGNWSEWSAEARATPVRDLASTASEETTTDARLESLAEEPSQAPNPEPINHSDPLEKMAVLVSLGIFAFFVLAAVLVIIILIWLRVRKQGKDKTKPNFLVAATHLKALPKAQIL